MACGLHPGYQLTIWKHSPIPGRGKGIDGTLAIIIALRYSASQARCWLLSMQAMSDCRHEFAFGLLAVHIDLRKASDLVYRESLWEILKPRGISTKINSKPVFWCLKCYKTCILILKELKNLVAHIFFSVNLQMHQRFSTGKAIIQNQWGQTLSAVEGANLDFAGELENLFQSIENPSRCLLLLGLTVSSNMTKIQDFGDVQGVPARSVLSAQLLMSHRVYTFW